MLSESTAEQQGKWWLLRYVALDVNVSVLCGWMWMGRFSESNATLEFCMQKLSQRVS